MKKTRTSKTLLILAGIAVIGIGSYAYADWGMGYGRHMGYGWGSGYGPGMMGPGAYEGYGMGPGMMGYPGDRSGNWGNLSDEDAKKIEKEQATFLRSTEQLRQDIYAKGLELRSELSKENPNAENAATLQKELSGLEGRLDQKRVDHMITLRKITPNLGRSFAGRGMMDEGPGDYAPCWR
ncbi:MAG: periplasmic heavy metal sensor [Pseudomonadota bacterium]